MEPDVVIGLAAIATVTVVVVVPDVLVAVTAWDSVLTPMMSHRNSNGNLTITGGDRGHEHPQGWEQGEHHSPDPRTAGNALYALSNIYSSPGGLACLSVCVSVCVTLAPPLHIYCI